MIKIFKKNMGIEVFDLGYKFWSFPAGEVGIKLDESPRYWHYNGDHIIIARLKKSEDIISLLLVVDAIRRHDPYTNKIRLFLPYLPYARQDRVCAKGESLSLKVFADLINNLNVDDAPFSGYY